MFVILIITCSETTILLCYFHLCAEVSCHRPVYQVKDVKCHSRQDYHWWWRSFLTSGFTAFYFAVYCIHYFFTKLDIEDSASTFLYFGYTSIMVFCFFLLTGILEMIFKIRILFPSFYTNCRNDWLLCMLLVCEENLQRCESRLDDNFYLTWTIFRKFLTCHVRKQQTSNPC